ncbi:hypothetical protein WS79_29360 [Burkholderia territorii]|nr:hypothetical protein WS79_29360 [Burkholderia territorii]
MLRVGSTCVPAADAVDGREVAPDYHAWIDAQLDAHGGSVEDVLLAHRYSAINWSKVQSLLHYFMYDCGDDQDNFVQLEVWEDQEFVQREVFPRTMPWRLPDVHELRSGWHDMPVERFKRRALGAPHYRLKVVIDMKHFSELAEARYNARRQGDGDRQLAIGNWQLAIGNWQLAIGRAQRRHGRIACYQRARSHTGLERVINFR